MKTYSEADVARWIILEAGEPTAEQLSNALFYCQGRYLDMTGKPLFSKDIPGSCIDVPAELETHITHTDWETLKNTPPCCEPDDMKRYFVTEMYGPDDEDLPDRSYTDEEVAQKIRENFTDEELKELLEAN